MKIVCWNVNGIRACLSKGFTDFLIASQADYFCIQESKASQDQVPETFLGQKSIWSSAEKKGYSGVVTFSPHQNVEMKSKCGLAPYDSEGRVNLIFEKKFTLVNVYFPNGAASPERHAFKMAFLDNFLIFLKELEKERGPLVVCGDYNIAHREIDIHDPVSNKDSSGFLPEERAWMTKFLDHGFIDSYRHVHGDKRDQYSWWSYRMRSRERNKGWRIDYICVSESLKKKIRAAEILPNVMGSDHCPLYLELDI